MGAWFATGEKATLRRKSRSAREAAAAVRTYTVKCRNLFCRVNVQGGSLGQMWVWPAKHHVRESHWVIWFILQSVIFYLEKGCRCTFFLFLDQTSLPTFAHVPCMHLMSTVRSLFHCGTWQKLKTFFFFFSLPVFAYIRVLWVCAYQDAEYNVFTCMVTGSPPPLWPPFYVPEKYSQCGTCSTHTPLWTASNRASCCVIPPASCLVQESGCCGCLSRRSWSPRSSCGSVVYRNLVVSGLPVLVLTTTSPFLPTRFLVLPSGDLRTVGWCRTQVNCI